MKRLAAVVAVSVLGLLAQALAQIPTQVPAQTAPAPVQSCPADDMPAIIRQVVENDLINDQRGQNYTYIEREEERNLDGHGKVKSTEATTRETMVLYGEQVSRLIERDGKPLSAKDAAKEDQRIQKITDKWERETEGERRKRLAGHEKQRDEERGFVREVNEAYNFQMLPDESLNGRSAYVMDAQPRAGFHPQTKDGKYLPKFRFRVWIDKDECQWAKLDAETIETVSWGLFLARLHKGSHIVLEQTRFNDEVWLPLRQQIKLDARVALIKNFRLEMDTTYRDYKKFRAETRIVSAGPVE